ncbi:MAG: hypothetical protein WCP07_04105 [bacterium]
MMRLTKPGILRLQGQGGFLSIRQFCGYNRMMQRKQTGGRPTVQIVATLKEGAKESA